MAIYAEVRFRQLSALASYRQIHAAASLPVAAVVIETQSPSTEVSFQNLFLSASHQLLAPQLKWQSLFVSDLVLNTEKTITIFTDALGFSDAPVFSLATSLDDAFTFSDISALNLDTQRLDNFSLSEVSSLQFTSPQSDTFGLGDSQILSVDKALVDAASMGDVFARVFTSARSFSDSSAIADQFSFASSKVEGHLFGFSDASVLSVTKGESEVVSLAETSVKTVFKAPGDAALLSEDSLTLLISESGFSFDVQSGGDLSISMSLAEDVTHQDVFSAALEKVRSDAFSMITDVAALDYSRPESDSAFLTEEMSHTFQAVRDVSDSALMSDSTTRISQLSKSDSIAFSSVFSRTGTFNRTFTDAFTLDETVSVGLGYLFDKSNIYTITDSLSFGFSRGLDESIILQDTLAISAGMSVSDSSAITELATLTTGTVLTDAVSMGDSLVLVIGGFSQSSILNKGLVGSMLLNAE